VNAVSSGTLIALLFSVLAVAGPQILPQPGNPVEERTPGFSEYNTYGEPRPVDLASFAGDAGTYQRANVRTKGRVDILLPNQYYILSDGIDRVLLIPVRDMPSDIQTLVGFPVEVTGIVRQIREKQYVRGVDLDLIEDPALPPMPAPRMDWPRVSLTAIGIFDISPLARRGGAPALTRDIAADPARYAGKKVTVVGQFRGRNLFDDLPAHSQREAADWVLKDGDSAMWVTGKKPQGKGWSLDPGYKGDASKWLEVIGQAEVVKGIVYLRASQVALTSRPKAADAGDR
jgi:hypothetical protein